MRLLNLRINFYLLRTFCPHLGRFFFFFFFCVCCFFFHYVSEVTVNHLKKARGEIWPKRSERRNNTKKTTKMMTKTLFHYLNFCFFCHCQTYFLHLPFYALSKSFLPFPNSFPPLYLSLSLSLSLYIYIYIYETLWK